MVVVVLGRSFTSGHDAWAESCTVLGPPSGTATGNLKLAVTMVIIPSVVACGFGDVLDTGLEVVEVLVLFINATETCKVPGTTLDEVYVFRIDWAAVW